MTCLVVLAKHWTPGYANTRLAQVVGAEAAADLQRVLVVTLLHRWAQLGSTRILAYAPPEQAEPFRQIVGALPWRLMPQSEGQFGDRLADAARAGLATGEPVLLLGSDSPTVPLASLQHAITCLNDADVVIGPAWDGGYYTLGMRRFLPELFVDMPWSSPHLFARTLDRLQRRDASLTVEILPAAGDLDTWEDVVRLADAWRQQPEGASEFSALRRWLEQFGFLDAEPGRAPKSL